MTAAKSSVKGRSKALKQGQGSGASSCAGRGCVNLDEIEYLVATRGLDTITLAGEVFVSLQGIADYADRHATPAPAGTTRRPKRRATTSTPGVLKVSNRRPSSQFIPLREAANLVGVHWVTVRRAIDKGKIEGCRWGTRLIFVRRRDVLAQYRPIPTTGNVYDAA